MAGTNALRESEKAALLTLLADEQELVYQAVRARLLSVGKAASEWLRPHQFSRNRLLARRVSEILRDLALREADERFCRFCLTHGEDFDIEEAAWLLAQTAYAEINVEGYRALLDDFAGELRPRLSLYRRGNQLLSRINQYLFGEQDFGPHPEGQEAPEWCYLNQVMDGRMGNALSLSLLYVAVARRLELPVAGVNLAGHFVCRYQSAAEEIYIDPFHHGRLMSRAECVHQLIRSHCDVKDDYLSPVRARQWLGQFCERLAELYRLGGEQAGFDRMTRYLTMLRARAVF